MHNWFEMPQLIYIVLPFHRNVSITLFHVFSRLCGHSGSSVDRAGHTGGDTGAVSYLYHRQQVSGLYRCRGHTGANSISRYVHICTSRTLDAQPHTHTSLHMTNCTADLRLCFRYSDSTIPLLLIAEISSS